MAICVWFRNDFGRKAEIVGEHTVCGLVHGLMCSLYPLHQHVFMDVCALLLRGRTLTYPIPLEAILAAEVRFLAHLLTVGTLKVASIIVAARTFAFPLLLHGHLARRCLVHVGRQKMMKISRLCRKSLLMGRDEPSKCQVPLLLLVMSTSPRRCQCAANLYLYSGGRRRKVVHVIRGMHADEVSMRHRRRHFGSSVVALHRLSSDR